MADGDDFYTNAHPRISKAEIKEVETLLDTWLQKEHMSGAHAGPIAVYPLDEEEFKEKAARFLKLQLEAKMDVYKDNLPQQKYKNE